LGIFGLYHFRWRLKGPMDKQCLKTWELHQLQHQGNSWRESITRKPELRTLELYCLAMQTPSVGEIYEYPRVSLSHTKSYFGLKMVLVLASCSLKKTQKYLNLNKGSLSLQLVEPSFLFPSFSLNNNTRYKNKSGRDLPSSSKHTIEISRHGAAQHRLHYLTRDEVSALEQVQSPLWFGRITICLPHSPLSPRAMVCASLPLYFWKSWV
jgi:hypothetical protein